MAHTIDIMRQPGILRHTRVVVGLRTQVTRIFSEPCRWADTRLTAN